MSDQQSLFVVDPDPSILSLLKVALDTESIQLFSYSDFASFDSDLPNLSSSSFSSARFLFDYYLYMSLEQSFSFSQFNSSQFFLAASIDRFKEFHYEIPSGFNGVFYKPFDLELLLKFLLSHV
eukprot:COSAG05_NODE_7019_length_865_cov_1.497389_2_plen_123_part_00